MWRDDDRRMLIWLCSQWCNYSCTYCWQQHTRKQVFRGTFGHWADNAPVDAWLKALDKVLPAENASIHLTGGEVLLDRKNVGPLVAGFHARGWTVDIDTNGSFKPTDWPFDVTQVPLMVSYHPEMVTIEQWLVNIRGLISAGWPVTNGAFVARPGRLDEFREARDGLKGEGLCINVAPVGFSWDGFSSEEREEVESCIPYSYRSGETPFRKRCLFPSIAYEMDPDGTLFAACHRIPSRIGSVFDETPPPLFDSSTPCPKRLCTCEDKFLFLDELALDVGLTPKSTYSDILRTIQ